MVDQHKTEPLDQNEVSSESGSRRVLNRRRPAAGFCSPHRMGEEQTPGWRLTAGGKARRKVQKTLRNLRRHRRGR